MFDYRDGTSEVRPAAPSRPPAPSLNEEKDHQHPGMGPMEHPVTSMASPTEAAAVLSHWSDGTRHPARAETPDISTTNSPPDHQQRQGTPESPAWSSLAGLNTGLDWPAEQSAQAADPWSQFGGTQHGIAPGLRGHLEERFDENFSGVEVKRGLSSRDQRSGVRAVAEHERITVDQTTLDHQYEPEHQEILAEELAHIVQKRRGRITPDRIDAASGGRVTTKPVATAKSERGRLEGEAETAAAAVVRGERPHIAAGARPPARQFRMFKWGEDKFSKGAGSVGNNGNGVMVGTNKLLSKGAGPLGKQAGPGLMCKLENTTAFKPRQTNPLSSTPGQSAGSAIFGAFVPQAGIAMDKIGGAFDDKGINLRDKPDDKSSRVLKNLPFGTRFLIEAELPGGWYKVRVLGGGNGYVAKHLVSIAPEPGALLHKIQNTETAIGIAERFYKNAVKPGEDLRFFVNVLSYVNPEAIAKPVQDDSWKKAKALKDYAIWVPSATFALSLRGKVGSGSITGGAWAQVRDASAYVIRTLIEQLPGGKQVMAWLEKVGPKIANVLSHPGRFLGNLVAAVKKGFNDFTGNIVTNIEKSIVSLLTGSLAGQGISMPAKFDAAGILKLSLGVLNINRASFEEKLVKQGISRSSLHKLEKLSEIGPIIADIHKNGLAPSLQKFLANADTIKDTLFSELKSWIVTQAIKQGLIALASFFVPGGGLIQLAIKIYDTVMFIIDKMTMIKNVVTSIVNSLSNIVDGKIDAAASKVEHALQLGLTLGLGFLANLAKLGSIAKKVKEILARVRKSIDNGLNKLAKFVADKARPLLARMSSKKTRSDAATPTNESGTTKAATTKPVHDPQHDAKVEAGLDQIEIEETKLDRDKDNKLTKAQAKQVAATVKKHNPVFTKIDVDYDKPAGEINYNWYASFGTRKSSRKPYTDDLEPAREEGTYENPFLIDWPKPASAQYKPLYFGAKRETPKTQNELSKLVGQPDDKGTVVQIYTPHQQSVLSGGQQIGVSAKYQIDIGSVIGPLAPKGITSPGGRTLNKILEKYGFVADSEGLDADHIHEIQLGGPDKVENMWPLDESINSSSGKKIDTMTIPLINGKSVKVYQLREHLTKSHRQYFFKVKSTR